MFGIIVGLIPLALVTVLLGWLTRRARGSGRAWVKWPGIVLGALFTLVFALLTVTAAIGAYKLYAVHRVQAPEMSIAGTPDQIARGEHLAVVLCASCHSLNGDLPLSGGKNLAEDTGLPLGDIYPPSITPAGDIKDMSDAQLFVLIRTGVNEEGRATAMAAILGPRSLSDEDTQAVIAYLRQSPAVDAETPEFKPSVLMAMFAGAGLISLNVSDSVNVVSAPPRGATLEYGKYVMGYMDCVSCHGPKLDGSVPPPNPPAPDIRGTLSGMSKDEFISLVHAEAAVPKPGNPMPWRFIAQLDDVELEALYLFAHQTASQ